MESGDLTHGTRVIVATDLSEADVALREGAAFASASRAQLAVVHVVPTLDTVSMLFPQRHAAEALSVGTLMRRADELVRERIARLECPASEVFIEEGVDYAEIVKCAERWRADTIVVGSHGRSGIARVFGGVAERVVRYADCAVLVARSAAAGGHVLAATDLSEPSLIAITAGADEARRRGAQLEVAHAIGFLDLEATYLLVPARKNFHVDEAARYLSERVPALGIDAMCKILDSPPAAAILREAEAIGAELVVVGTHGRTGLARILLGSVTEKVVREAHCSVLVARARRPG